MLGYVTTNYYDVRCNCKPFVSNRATSVKDGSHFCLPAERSMTLSASVTTDRSRALIGPRVLVLRFLRSILLLSCGNCGRDN